MDYDNKINLGTWKKDLRLYVHVPFCIKKCNYCDFLSAPSKEEQINAYFEALYKEIESYKGRTDDYVISSVYIGGGTPSCVDSEKIVRVMEELKKVFRFKENNNNVICQRSCNEINKEAEISIEINPGTISATGINRKKLSDYKNAGINRLSFGLQSTHDHELKLLGRIHTYFQFEENYYLARETGFKNINIDLMSGLPGQTLKTWEESLIKTALLKPEHISAYSLIIEEGTPFYEIYGPDGPDSHRLPSEDLDREMYKRTKELLFSYGYERYEISNYAQPGFECRHNRAYWEPADYLGLGLGSASLIENTRFHNTFSLHEYIYKIGRNANSSVLSLNADNQNKNLLLLDYFGIREDTEVLSKAQQMEEFMFLGLRKTKGVSIQGFYEKFGVTIDEIYGSTVNNLKNQGLIESDNERIWLTDFGVDVSNRVLAEFLFN